MSTAEEEIKIGIKTNYDGSGVEKARADLEGLQEESSQQRVPKAERDRQKRAELRAEMRGELEKLLAEKENELRDYEDLHGHRDEISDLIDQGIQKTWKFLAGEPSRAEIEQSEKIKRLQGEIRSLQEQIKELLQIDSEESTPITADAEPAEEEQEERAPEKPRKPQKDGRIAKGDAEKIAWKVAELREELFSAIDSRENERERQLAEQRKEIAHDLDLALEELKRRKDAGEISREDYTYEKEVLKLRAKVEKLEVKAAEAASRYQAAQEREAVLREAVEHGSGGGSKKEKEEYEKAKAALERAQEKREAAAEDYRDAANAAEEEKRRADEASASAAETLALAKKIAEDKRAEEERKRAAKAEREAEEAERKAEKERAKAEAAQKKEQERKERAEKQAKSEPRKKPLATTDSRGDAMKQIQRELAQIAEEYKVTGRYAARDTRLQAEIYAQDEAALMARQKQLLALRRTPGMDAATQRAINEKLKETDRQLHGLRDNMQRASRESQRAVVGLKPLGQTAKNKGWQVTLKHAERAYVQLARKAEREASKGDEKALDRTVKAMRRNALQQEKLTGYTGRAAMHQRSVENHLRNIAQGTSRQDRGLTAEQRQQNSVHRLLEGKRKHTSRAERAARKQAAAAEREARATERAAAKAVREARSEQRVEVQAEQMHKAIQTCTARAQQMTVLIQQLTAAVAQLSGYAQQGVSATASAIKQVTSEINRIKRQIDRLNRKI